MTGEESLVPSNVVVVSALPVPFMKSALITHLLKAAWFSRIVHSSPAPPDTYAKPKGAMTFCASTSRSRSVTMLIFFSLFGTPLASVGVFAIDSAVVLCASRGPGSPIAAATPAVRSKFLRLRPVAISSPPGFESQTLVRLVEAAFEAGQIQSRIAATAAQQFVMKASCSPRRGRKMSSELSLTKIKQGETGRSHN